MYDDQFFANNRETGRRLAALRRERGMSQSKAASALGVTQSCISQLENGRRRISFAAAAKLAELYGAELSEMIPEPADRPAAIELKGDEGSALLVKLAEASKISLIDRSVKAFLMVSAYRMLRAVYSLNPHNSQELFSLSEEDAFGAAEDFLREEPHRIKQLMFTDSEKGLGRIELPVEDSARLRAFIRECERFLGDG